MAEQEHVENQEVFFLHELINNNYTLTASDSLTGKLLTQISLPKADAIALVQGMVRTLLGESHGRSTDV